jgi:hypothetical protein
MPIFQEPSFRNAMRTPFFLSLLAATLLASPLVAAPPELLTARVLGGGGEDNLEGVAFGPDGHIYVVGNAAKGLAGLPEGVEPLVLGASPDGWAYGRGFVAKLSADGRRLLALARFAPGAAKCTSVAVTPRGVYVGGYASPAMEPLIADLGGLIRKGSWRQRKIDTYCPGEHHSEPRRKDAHDQRGVPFVLRLDAGLTELTAGTLLEGWQSVWRVPRPLGEDRWQPVCLAPLSTGEIAVAHDGGYNRIPEAGPPGWADFYRVPDYVSRLSADLSQRRWKATIYRPRVDPKRAWRHIDRTRRRFRVPADVKAWPYDSLGQTRILRMRADSRDRLYVGGWSPGRTSMEPWWTPFCLRLDGRGGVEWSVYSPDPMSGEGGRMGGLVSDAAVRSVHVDADDHLLVAGIGDGGNNVMRRDPRDYTKVPPKLRGQVYGFPGRVLFFGVVTRVDAASGRLLGGNHLAAFVKGRYQETWATDLAPAAGGRVCAIGRHTWAFGATDDAWFRPFDEQEGDKSRRGRRAGAHSFVRLYGPAFRLRFSTSLPGVSLMTMARRGGRFAAVGQTRGDAPPLKESPAKPNDARDGYLLVWDAPSRQSDEAGEERKEER